ncbi:BatA domain-containing protein [Tundrisphaera lichenicola]|uniref:BatA domain-containing protein n=1 Tax=Tundrisphaera lichenicola TaxID=2029860 RepID=UPI003EB8967F
MDISLLHAGLAAGAALAAVPVILHLFMRQTPKHVIFPALRLIRERHKRSKKRLKVKNWLLLAARMLLLALMALALARPTLNSETPLGDREIPTALALVFDTSMSMGYTDRGNTRLKEAQLRAAEILKKTTADSEVFVIDSALPVRPPAVSPSSARKLIDALTLKAANRPLNAALVQAAGSVAASNLARREVYVLTDLASSAWDLGATRTTEELEKFRKDKKKVNTYILKLTPKEVVDVAVVSAEPSSTVAAEGEPMEIKVTLRSSGPADSRVAELYLDGQKREQKLVDIPANGEKEVSFLTPTRLETGLHQGRIKLGGRTDFMEFDDTRYFSFNVQPALRVLVVADRTTAQDLDAQFVMNALSPEASVGAPEGVGTPYKIDRETRPQFQARPRLSTKDYACVFLLNLDQLTDRDWARLFAYVREGGGLVVAPGDRSLPSGYEGAAAASLLPAVLEAKKEAPVGTKFGKASYDHPLFDRHPKLLDPELTAWPVYRYWGVRPSETARTILQFTDGAPALIERSFKGARTGHVLLWTTPLSRRFDRAEPAAWNELPLSWAFLDILMQTVPYLAGTAGERLNYEAGEDAVITIDPARKASTYTVQGPEEELTQRLSAPTATDTLLIPTPSKEGQWEVKGTGPDGSKMKMGFSVNVPSVEAQVVELKPNDLDGLFGGKDYYKIALDAASLDREQAIGRYGLELFPWFMLLILALVTAENLLANKFHRDTATA